MITYRKYQIPGEQWPLLQSLIQAESHLNASYVDCTVSELGNNLVSMAVMNGVQVVNPAIFGTDVLIDVLWQGLPHTAFEPYEIWPANPTHHFASDTGNAATDWAAIYQAERAAKTA